MRFVISWNKSEVEVVWEISLNEDDQVDIYEKHIPKVPQCLLCDA